MTRRIPAEGWSSLIRERVLPMLSRTQGVPYKTIRKHLGLSPSATLDVLTAARRQGLVKCKGDFTSGEWRRA